MSDQHPIPVVQWAQQQLSQFGRIGATRLVMVPALAAAVPAASVPTQAPLLTWRDPGTVIAMYAQELAGTVAAFAGMSARLQFMGDEDFITNGSSGDFAPFLALVGPNTNWFPMTRRVRRGDNWTITYKSVAGGTPAMMFAFIADADLGRQQREMAAARG